MLDGIYGATDPSSGLCLGGRNFDPEAQEGSMRPVGEELD